MFYQAPKEKQVLKSNPSNRSLLRTVTSATPEDAYLKSKVKLLVFFTESFILN